MNPEESIRTALSVLFPEGSVVELRALGERTHYGYYTDFDRLARDAAVLDSTSGISGIYITLNQVHSDLLSRCANRMKRAGQREPQTSDGDIMHRLWFPIDIDPVRPAGISSSDAEHAAAFDKAEKIREFLSERGWPDPVIADSGNGAHLLYAIDLPNTQESTTLIKNCLTVLSTFFSDKESEVDTSVSNAARIWKLYGTLSRKGDSTSTRPHRRSLLLEVPQEVHVVEYEQIAHLSSLLFECPVEMNPSKAQGTSTSGEDLGAWLSSHGLSYRKKPFAGGRIFLFDHCPFSPAHKDGAYAIQFDNGGIFAGCHHNSCGGGRQRWQELRERFEGTKGREKQDYETYRRKSIREKAQAKAEYYGNHPETTETIQTTNPDTNISRHQKTAYDILTNGNPIEYILNSFAQEHEGDFVIAQCLIMSFASRTVINSNGLHVLVTAESGKGKSHAFDTMIQHIPQDSRLDGRVSDKALFYAEDLKPGTALCLDDVSLSDSMQETLKGVTTSFKKPFIYRTVNKDRKGQVCIIPERCVWWVAKKEGTGDDQIWNRMLTCWIDDSREQDEKVLVRELASAAALPTAETLNRDELIVCQQIWEQLTPVYVVIPYATRIRFTSSANRRNPGMLLDLIKSIACLCQFQREKTQAHGQPVIYANIDDFRYANRIYQALNGESGSQITKLTRSESDLITVLRSGKQEFTAAELSKLTGSSERTIRKQICGYNSYGKDYSGLLEKCPAVSYLDRTVTDEEGRVRRSCKCFVWDDEVYQNWVSGGGCWLDSEGSDQDKQSPDHDDDRSGRAGENPHRTGTPTPDDSDNSGVESENTSYNKNNNTKNTKGREGEGAYGAPAPDYPSPTADFAPTPEERTGQIDHSSD